MSATRSAAAAANSTSWVKSTFDGIDKEYEEDEKDGSESPEAPTDGEASSESGVKEPEQDAGAGTPDVPGATHADLVRFVVVTVVVLTIVRLMLG